MIKEIAVIFPAGRYTWFRWTAGKATTIYTKKGTEYYMSKGAKFGIRPATSKKGMYRVITQELGPGIVFSMDQDEINKLTKNSVMARVETAASDRQILEFLTNNLTETIELKDVKELVYTRVSTGKILLSGSFDSGWQLPYVIFVEGKKTSDLYSGVGQVGLTIASFIQWLQKHGAKEKQKRKEKRQRNFVMYD